MPKEEPGGITGAVKMLAEVMPPGSSGVATPNSQTRWRLGLRLAASRPVVRRGLGFSIVVGSILAWINHSDALLRGDLTDGRWLRIGLTYLVPYLVSTFSSVGALLQADPGGAGRPQEPRP